ncbi:MAG: molybdopterin molybdotransferase MoeA [Anaerolineaceae bacterium]|nr:molybdopterin molybdotransferase MoeA [Anaerolineaceae bacterium]MCB9101090.1 molybdopterin molybdotransferase MoeA [Anaerolineales bacterium]
MPIESPYPMISIEKALDIVTTHIQPLPSVTLPFYEAQGYVLAEDIRAAEPMPPFAASSVDGYAVVAGDGPGRRRIVGDQAAGYMAGVEIEPGTSVRVTTGAPVPLGADAVVMVEETEVAGDYVEILATTIQSGSNIRPVGQDIEQGQLVLPRGTVIGPAEMGLLGTVGQSQVMVYRRPRVAIMSTGDEIVEPDQPLAPGQIRDANRFTLMGAVREAGGEPVDLGIVRDKAGSLADTIDRGLVEADVLLTSGGVSMGQLDLVKPYLASRGTLYFGRVNTKPGKPVTFAVVDSVPCFAMPGFPVSALVSFEIFVRPALLKMAGQPHIYRPREKAILAQRLSHTSARTEFQRVVLTRRVDGRLVASTTGFQGSGRLLSMAGANGLVILPHGQADYEIGATVEALIIGQILSETDANSAPIRGV